MSDLQCPATVLVARHGLASYAVPGLLTDDGGWLTDLGAAQMDRLAQELLDDPRYAVGAVWSSELARAVQSARRVAHRLGVPHELSGGLDEVRVGELAGAAVGDARFMSVLDTWRRGDLTVGVPGGEDGQAVVGRFRESLQEIADAHRGQTVLVLTHGWIMSVALPWLCDNVRPDLSAGQVVPHAAPARLRIDADGWVLDSWPGRPACCGGGAPGMAARS